MRFSTGLIAAAGLARAIIVAPGSPCATKCGNVLDATAPDELTCAQDDYLSGGALFQECLECELYSDYSGSSQTDTQWALYNLRYAFSYCLFGYPNHDDVVTTPCITSEACGKFQSGMQYQNMSTKTDPYAYCSVWPVNDEVHVKQCNLCLQAGGQEYLANFFTVLQAGCEQRPEEGVTVAVDGEVFSTNPVEVSDPAARATVDPAWFDQGPLDVGARAGIAAGGLIFLLSLVGCFIIWRGKKRRRAFLRNYDPSKHGRKGGWPGALKIGNMQEISTNNTPLSQRPLRAWDDSPMTAASEQPFPRYFSPYSSQFNSPVSANEALQPQWPVLGAEKQMTPQEVGRNIGLAFGSTDNVAVEGDGKGKKPEEYELAYVEGNGSGGYQYPQPPVAQDNNYPAEQQQQQQHQETYFTHGHERSYSGSYRNFPGNRGGQGQQGWQ